jgi:hypothetical protein
MESNQYGNRHQPDTAIGTRSGDLANTLSARHYIFRAFQFLGYLPGEPNNWRHIVFWHYWGVCCECQSAGRSVWSHIAQCVYQTGHV